MVRFCLIMVFLWGLLFSSSEVDFAKEELLRSRTRTALINFLIKKNKYTSYLEIGVDQRENLNKINCKSKIGVDPNVIGNPEFLGTSDSFFEQNDKMFDIVFIDGLHLYEQVIKDINNAIKFLNPGGTIVMHDCLPPTRAIASRTDKVELGVVMFGRRQQKCVCITIMLSCVF